MTDQIEKIVGGEWVEGRFVSRDLTPAEIAINALIDAFQALEKRVKTFEELATCRCEYPSPTHLGYCSDCGKIERNEP